MKIGIRREDKSPWEARIPLVPEHIAELRRSGVEIWIQPSTQRVFKDEELADAGAKISEDLSPCSVIMGVKEIPLEQLQENKIYIFFSHTIKGQPQNMPMLRRLQTLGCGLIDYERIVDSDGRRLVSFSRFAGLAGFLDSLWLYGTRMQTKGKKTPLASLKQSRHYSSLDDAKKHLREVAQECRKDPTFSGLNIAITGLGRVGRGLVEMARLLEPKIVAPQQLPHLKSSVDFYLALFDLPDLVNHIKGNSVDPTEYRNRPELYRSAFKDYLPYIDVLANGIYWEEPYPRVIRKEDLGKDWQEKNIRLEVISDISCDINGSIEMTSRTGDPGDPYFIYNPTTDTYSDSLNEEGILIMVNDILPTEFPRESSRSFSDALVGYVPELAKLDSTQSLRQWNLSPELQPAVILHQGRLTQNYQYIREYL